MAKDKIFPFYKMTGGGNDFVLFDNRKEVLPEDYSFLAKRVCDRKFSIGADGILILEKSEEADFKMLYYNADGSRAEMCGNGARCIARFATLLKIGQTKVSFITDAGPLSAELKGESVKLKMSDSKDIKLDFPIRLEDGKEFHLSFINTGVPHAVLMVNDLEKTDVQGLGKQIRYHKEFAPEGTNADFIFQRDVHTVFIRTYERGVEGETLACGTGAVAASLICAAKGLVESPVDCSTKGGEVLKVFFAIEKTRESAPLQRLIVSFNEVYLEGPAVFCFKGEIEL